MPSQRRRRSYREIFLDKLTELSDGEQKLIGNNYLRTELDWDKDWYDEMKRQLVAEKIIIVGQGRGGTVALAKAPGAKALSVFVSYAHEDEGYKNELLKHLKPLEQLHLVDAWHDRRIKAGEEWGKMISDQLQRADIILLLVSIDFINSPYCHDIELEKAIQLHRQGKARVIPVILRNCLWHHMPFADLQALPTDGKAISAWGHQDEALTNVSQGIRQVAEDLLANR
jgi:hypothetical protein